MRGFYRRTVAAARFPGLTVEAWGLGDARGVENSMKTISMQGMLLAIVFSLAVVALAAPVQKRHEEWKTYRSPDFGFVIAYPESMSFSSEHPVGPAQGTEFPICDDTTVACFQYNGHELDGTPTHTAGVSVNILRDAKSETECVSSIDPSLRSSKITRIRGTLFHYGDTSEIGLGSGRSMTEYVAFNRNVCFEVALVTASRNIGSEEIKDEDLRPVNRRTWRRIMNNMDMMLHSFAFIGPVKDGPDWSVYVDWGCGDEFEYPSSTTLEKVRDYSDGVFYSNRIACEQAFAYQRREYDVAVKMNLRDANALDDWLSRSGYPGLEQVKIIAKDDGYTEYSDGTYTYVFVSRKVFIFTVSDMSDHLIASDGDRVFAHLVGSFRVR